MVPTGPPPTASSTPTGIRSGWEPSAGPRPPSCLMTRPRRVRRIGRRSAGAGGSNKNNDPISDGDCAARVPPLTGSACDTWHWDAGNVPPPRTTSSTSYAYAKIQPGELKSPGHTRVRTARPQRGQPHRHRVPQGPSRGWTKAIPCNDPGTGPHSVRLHRHPIPSATPSCRWTSSTAAGSAPSRCSDWNGTRVHPGGATPPVRDATPADTICVFNNGSGDQWWPVAKLRQDRQRGHRHRPRTDSLSSASTLRPSRARRHVSPRSMGQDTQLGVVHSRAEGLRRTNLVPHLLCAAISISRPDDVNEVGQWHTFTVTVSKTIGGLFGAPRLTGHLPLSP